jgi:hypothetical protein
VKRVFLIGGLWFLFWMALCAGIGALRAPANAVPEAIYSGVFNGAWLALITSFAWPWIMPRKLDRWIDRPDA